LLGADESRAAVRVPLLCQRIQEQLASGGTRSRVVNVTPCPIRNGTMARQQAAGSTWSSRCGPGKWATCASGRRD
jgi:hypothetical protein